MQSSSNSTDKNNNTSRFGAGDAAQKNISQNTKNIKRKRLQIESYDETIIENVPVRLSRGFSLSSGQRKMMERILEAVKRKENMLCEFPAGNGKTVSLLSATCAWLQQYNEEKRAAMEKCPIHGVPEDSEDLGRDVKPVFEKEVKQEVNECGDSCLDEPPLVLLDTNPKKEEVEEKPECSCLPRVRIYYGTQSHKQIAQVVKEFALLPYANVIKHTILGSRKHLCINSEAKKQADLSSYCKKINGDNGSGCPFKTAMRPRFEKAEMMRQHLLENGSDVFDMEDLVKTFTASSPSICPYYTTNRVLTQDADLIFCPFLYLVDPLIRNSSEVHLEDAIVILDDAHHLEEACREAASFSFSEQELDETVFSFRSKRIEAEEMIKKHVDVAENENLAILKDFHVHLQFLETLSREIMYLFCRVARRGKGLTSEELFAYLNDFSIGIYLFLPPESPKYTLIKKSFETISEMKDSESRHLEMFRPSDTAISCIEKWIYFQSCFGIEQWQSSYRLNISYDRIKKPFILDSSPSTSSTSEAMKNEEIPFKTNHKALHEGYKTSLNLLCTSSSIAFSDAFRESRSVILSSESLIPMNELEEELGTEFPNKVEGESEIPPENIFAGVLTKGPSGKEIECTYMMTSWNSNVYPDVGEIIQFVCDNTPAGILCFLPSYRVLEGIKRYLQKKKIIEKIEKKKVVMFEKRDTDPAFLMRRLDSIISNPGKNGTLIFAVIRGKFSEGVAFANDRARVVISIGVPYADIHDDQIKAKKSYNNKINRKGDWYATHAFRPMNLALGRAFGNKDDWAAILMIDRRLGGKQPRVSKWIRDRLVTYPYYDEFKRDFLEFMNRKLGIVKIEL